MSPRSSTKFAQPLYIELLPARRLAYCSLVMHLLVALAWLTVPSGPLYTTFALLLTGWHALRYHRRQVVATSPSSVAALSWDSRRGWRIRDPACGWQTVSLNLPVYVSPGLVAIGFRRSRLRCSYAVITPDRLDADSFRRLRVRLIQSARGH